MKVNLTHHAGVERIDRISECLATYGMNEFVLELKKEQKLYRLTDTGILFIFNEDGVTLITGYIPSPDKVSAMYKESGYTQAPRHIMAVAVRNTRTHKRR